MVMKKILVAEDNPDDAFIFQMAFKKAALPHGLQIVDDGQQVINWLAGNGEFADRTRFPLPDMVILDLKMPIKTGFEALEWMRSHGQFRDLPAVVLTSSDDPRDLKRASELQATAFFVKSPHLRDVMDYLRKTAS
jgi:CheY-like chemotaxis protein